MSEIIELPIVDDDPKSGVFVDSEEFFVSPTEDEVADGNHLGTTIDISNDADTGARESYK